MVQIWPKMALGRTYDIVVHSHALRRRLTSERLCNEITSYNIRAG